MKAKILGISASPHKGGKVDTLVQEILSATRLPSEMVRLHNLKIEPCKACNGCLSNNQCVLKDNWGELSEKIINSNAVVLGSWAFSGMVDAATKAMMERFWSLRHHRQLTRGKVGVVAVVGINQELTENLADALLQFMRNNGMTALGRVTAAGANPCLGCKDSLGECEYSGVVAQCGFLERIGVSLYNPIEHQLGTLKAARILGQRVRHKVQHLLDRGEVN